MRVQLFAFNVCREAMAGGPLRMPPTVQGQVGREAWLHLAS